MDKIIGLKVLALRAFRTDMRKKKGLEVRHILFSDEKTYITLHDQDYYSHRDCDSSAKLLEIRQDTQMWGEIFRNKKNFPDANYFETLDFY